MASFDEMHRRHEASLESELASAEAAAAASGKEPFDLARLEALLEAEPGTYANHERSLRRDYYVMQDRLKTLAEFAAHVREMQSWGFWDE